MVRGVQGGGQSYSLPPDDEFQKLLSQIPSDAPAKMRENMTEILELASKPGAINQGKIAHLIKEFEEIVLELPSKVKAPTLTAGSTPSKLFEEMIQYLEEGNFAEAKKIAAKIKAIAPRTKQTLDDLINNYETRAKIMPLFLKAGLDFANALKSGDPRRIVEAQTVLWGFGIALRGNREAIDDGKAEFYKEIGKQ